MIINYFVCLRYLYIIKLINFIHLIDALRFWYNMYQTTEKTKYPLLIGTLSLNIRVRLFFIEFALL